MANRIFKPSNKNPNNSDPILAMYQKRSQELEKEISEMEALKSDPAKRKYKSRVSWKNQREGSKCHTMCASVGKSESKKKIPTDHWKGNEMEMWSSLAKEGYAYICAGRNSLVRSLVIADIDEDWDQGAILSMLGQAGLEPSYIREHLANGHKQVGFYVKELQIKRMSWTETPKGLVAGMSKIFPAFELYSAAYKLLNSFVLPGDPGYTGYNCQNPCFENSEWRTTWFNKAPMELEAVLAKMLDHFGKKEGYPSNCKNLEEKAAYASMWANKRRPSRESPMQRQTEAIFADELDERIGELGERLSSIKAREAKRLALLGCPASPYEASFDRLYFITCTQVANRWRKMEKLEKRYLPAMAEEALANMEVLGPTGYTKDEATSRIICDLRQIMDDSISDEPSVDWTKVGYTPIQRILSQEVRKSNKFASIRRMLSKISRISDRDWQSLTLAKIAKKVHCGTFGIPHARNFIAVLRQALSDSNISHKDTSKILQTFNFKECKNLKFWDHNAFIANFQSKLENFKFNGCIQSLDNLGKPLEISIVGQNKQRQPIIDYNNKDDRQVMAGKFMQRVLAMVGKDSRVGTERQHANRPGGSTRSIPNRFTA